MPAQPPARAAESAMLIIVCKGFIKNDLCKDSFFWAKKYPARRPGSYLADIQRDAENKSAKFADLFSGKYYKSES